MYVEVDIVMDPDISLRKAHDVSQALQDQLESLPGVSQSISIILLFDQVGELR